MHDVSAARVGAMEDWGSGGTWKLRTLIRMYAFATEREVSSILQIKSTIKKPARFIPSGLEFLIKLRI